MKQILIIFVPVSKIRKENFKQTHELFLSVSAVSNMVSEMGLALKL